MAVMDAQKMKAALGARIRARRVSLGLTPRQIADAMGTSRQCVQLWESGQTAPTSLVLLPLAHALEMSPLDLIDGLDPCAPPPRRRLPRGPQVRA